MTTGSVGKAKREALELQLAVLTKMSDLATAAFGLVAALAWNAAIQAIFKVWFKTDSAWPALLGYAVLVTLLAVLIIIWVGRMVGKLKPVVEAAIAKDQPQRT